MFGIEDGWIVTMLLLILAALLACVGYGVWRWNEEEGSDPAASGGGKSGSPQ